MKRVVFAMVAALSVAALSGCASCKNRCNGGCAKGHAGGGCDVCDNGCPTCKKRGQLFGSHFCDDSCLIGQRRRQRAAQQGVVHGPPGAQVTYPYYTVRGPRDFLSAAPRDIGH